MNITLEPGRYVVAVSGGVDSVVLLYLLRQLPDMQLTVAHFDHGIRSDSSEDQVFVRELAATHRLPYVYDRGNLGVRASEAAARQARYEFLHAARAAAGAAAVITAHHQDDALETAILNIVRGTGRRGLTSLKSTDIVKRPLLHVPKGEIVRYARDNQLLWREDSTNATVDYKRNYVRHKLLSRFGTADREMLHDIIIGLRQTNSELDELLGRVVGQMSEGDRLDRARFILLPHAAAREVMATWLRQHGTQDIDKKMLERLVHAAKTFADGRQVSVNRNRVLMVKKTYLALQHSERYNKPVYG